VVYSVVAGPTTEAEVRVTKTANTFSDISTETATCNRAIFACHLQTAADKGLNQMTSICRVSRDADTLKFSCRNGFGGTRGRGALLGANAHSLPLPHQIPRHQRQNAFRHTQKPSKAQHALSWHSHQTPKHQPKHLQRSPTWLAVGATHRPRPTVSPIRTVWKILEATMCVCKCHICHRGLLWQLP